MPTHRTNAKPPAQSRRRAGLRGAGLALLVLAGGCAAPAPAPDPGRPVPEGEIVSVNEGAGFVVTRVEVLPDAGQEATVFDQGNVVGRIRFTSILRPPYVAADLVEGRPRRGDRFRAEAGTEKRSAP